MGTRERFIPVQPLRKQSRGLWRNRDEMGVADYSWHSERSVRYGNQNWNLYYKPVVLNHVCTATHYSNPL